MSEFPEEMINLKMHETLNINNKVTVMRVPNGFIYLITQGRGISLSTQFINYDRQGEEMRELLYRKFQEIAGENGLDSLNNLDPDTQSLLKKLQ